MPSSACKKKRRISKASQASITIRRRASKAVRWGARQPSARWLLSFFFNDTATTEIYTLSLHDALPTLPRRRTATPPPSWRRAPARSARSPPTRRPRSEEHTSELQSRRDLVCRLLLERQKARAHCWHRHADRIPVHDD